MPKELTKDFDLFEYVSTLLIIVCLTLFICLLGQ